MFTFKERSDEELLELLKADKFDEFADELSKSYINQKLQEKPSQEQQNENSENAVVMEIDSTGQLLYEESETDNSEKSPEKKTDNRTSTIAFRVSDDELKKIEKRFQQSGFSSKGDFYRFCIMNAFVFKEDDSYLEKFSKVISGIGRNINQIAYHVNSTHRVYSEDIKNIQKGLEEIWRLLTFMESKRESVRQLNTSLTLQKPMTAFWLLLIYVFQNHTKRHSNSPISVSELAAEKLQLKHST